MQIVTEKKFTRKIELKNFLLEFIGILVAVFLASIGLNAFLMPNNFLDGGVTGLSLLINETLHVNLSFALISFSLPFLFLSYFVLGKVKTLKSLLAILLLAFLLSIETFPVLTNDKLLTAVFGGLFLGAGIGLAIRNGAVLDGSEVLGIFIFDKMNISIGKVILFLNIILFTAAAFALDVEKAMYSVLTFIVTSKVVDFLITGFEDFVGVTIVSRKSKQIQEAIRDQIGAGITVLKGVQGQGKEEVREDFDVIQTVVNRIDFRKLQNTISVIDDAAFIIQFDVNNVQNGVLRKYLPFK